MHEAAPAASPASVPPVSSHPEAKRRKVEETPAGSSGEIASRPATVPQGTVFVGNVVYDFHKGATLRETVLREYDVSSQASEGHQASLHNARDDLRNYHWMLVEYAAPVDVKQLADRLPRCLIDAVGNFVLIYKPTQQNIRRLLKVGTLEPTNVNTLSSGKNVGRGEHKRAQKDFVKGFQSRPGKHMSNMWLGEESDVGEYCSQTLLEAVQDLTAEQYAQAVLDARLKEDKDDDLTELERLMCNERIESRVKELRKLTAKGKTQVIYVNKAKENGSVQASSVFKDSWKKLLITIRDTSLLTPLMPRTGNKVTLETFLNFQELNQNLSLFIPGAARKGKTELAKLICVVLSLKYQKDDARFIFTTTVDSLRAVQGAMRPGVPVLLDEIGGNEDDDQLIYGGVSMWKNILQVKDAAANRARQDDLVWAARQPKVLTTNCDDLDAWIAVMFPKIKGSHREAITQRVAEVETIKESLYVNSCAPSMSVSCLPSAMSMQSALDVFDNQ